MRTDESRTANPSHDTQLQDHLVDQMWTAMEKRDHEGKRSSLLALIAHLRSTLDEV